MLSLPLSPPSRVDHFVQLSPGGPDAVAEMSGRSYRMCRTPTGEVLPRLECMQLHLRLYVTWPAMPKRQGQAWAARRHDEDSYEGPKAYRSRENKKIEVDNEDGHSTWHMGAEDGVED